MRKRLLQATIIPSVLLLAAATAFQTGISETADLSSSSLLIAMPEEYVNYTITLVNGSMWAKIDGTYPLHIISKPEPVLDSLPLVYPTPPGTTDVSISIDGTELSWSNYTEIYPEAIHHTALGDWSMINCTLHSIPENFTLEIHYEHPVMFINGSYTFLYDLNISPYLSPYSTKSTAYFTISMETNYTHLYVNAIATDETLTPIDYTTTRDNTVETITFQIVSEYFKPLLGDILITFTTPTNSSVIEFPCLFIILLIAIIATLVVRIAYNRKHAGT